MSGPVDPRTRELIFPVDWTFRIIVERERDPDCREELQKVLHRFEIHTLLEEGSVSSGGRYRTLLARVTIPSRPVLDRLPEELAAVPGVRTVL